jgi:hypothetical protein
MPIEQEALARALPRRLLRQFTIALLALGLAGAVSRASAQDLVATGPAAKNFRVGAFEISVLRDGGLAVPNDGSVFARNAKPAAVAKVLGDAGATADKIQLDIDALLIRMPDHLVERCRMPFPFQSGLPVTWRIPTSTQQSKQYAAWVMESRGFC